MLKPLSIACADGDGERDVDFTCEYLAGPVFATEPCVPIDDNLLERFRTADVIDVPEPGRTETGGANNCKSLKEKRQ